MNTHTQNKTFLEGLTIMKRKKLEVLDELKIRYNKDLVSIETYKTEYTRLTSEINQLSNIISLYKQTHFE